MADSLAPSRKTARASLYLSAPRRPLTWIKRRARRLARAFQINRREAVANAWQDWTYFNPGAARRTEHA